MWGREGCGRFSFGGVLERLGCFFFYISGRFDLGLGVSLLAKSFHLVWEELARCNRLGEANVRCR